VATGSPARLGPWRIAGLALVFIWFFFGGVGHFVLTKTFVSVTPDYVPMHLEVVWFTGVCEIAGALAILYRPLRSLAGWALLALVVCVTPVHIDMLVHAEKYRSLGLGVLWGRLILQPVFAFIVWWSTRPVGLGERQASA
jgi:uncharacterized membrane protein